MEGPNGRNQRQHLLEPEVSSSLVPQQNPETPLPETPLKVATNARHPPGE